MRYYSDHNFVGTRIDGYLAPRCIMTKDAAEALAQVQQRANRMLLQAVMTKHGFNAYPEEWWHFWVDNEPFPETYFNFPVQ